ncbi:hypothetical protein IG631_06389 [Alternaria alternata]|nr:hypothetical protein IG631_06389 [Alternaria alternata]
MAWPRKRHSSPFSRNTNSVSLVYNTAKILAAHIHPPTKIKVSFLSPEQTTHLAVCFGDISISKCRPLKLPHSQMRCAGCGVESCVRQDGKPHRASWRVAYTRPANKSLNNSFTRTIEM